jgi:hypothetical protein
LCSRGTQQQKLFSTRPNLNLILHRQGLCKG